MKNKEIEQRLRAAVEHAAPDALPDVRAGLIGETAAESGVIPISAGKKKHKKWVPAVSAAAAAILLLTGVFGWRMSAPAPVDSVVAIDVNPSIELSVSSAEKVLEVRALNDDAAVILDGMNLKNTDLNVAVNALIGSLLKHGYIGSEANSVLITVENANTEKGLALQQQLAREIDRLLRDNSVDGAILSQRLCSDDELQSLAETHHISSGKAALIQELIRQNPTLRFDDLAGCSVNDLNLLAESQNASLPGTTSTGAASDKAYIGAEKAIELALAHAGVSRDKAQGLSAKLDCEHGQMVYEVEFLSGSTEHEIDLNAKTGEILKAETEAGQVPPAQAIGESAAAQKALARAGLSQAEVTGLVAKYDEDDGRGIYEVEFRKGNTGYSVEIDALTGSVLDYEAKTKGDTSSSTSSSQGAVSTEKAKSIAFSHAGVSASQAKNLKVNSETEHGVLIYEVEFTANGVEYEYEIGQTGSILKAESKNKPSSSQAATAYIGEARAKEIAFSRAGGSASQAEELEVDLKSDHSPAVYEVEFNLGRTEYHCEINAVTGDVVKFKTEQDD